MQLDARKLPDGARLEADVCVIGAGPAGTSLARALAGLDLDVLVLESGGPRPDERVQELNEGTVIGAAYAGLRETRQRGTGGTARIWNTPVSGEPGAKYVPLDDCDFEERAGVPFSGWPFDRAELEPFYRRAQAICGLGPSTYRAEDWSDAIRPTLALTGDHLTTAIYQFGTARRFIDGNLQEIRGADNIRLCHHATVCALETDGSGRRVSAAKVACLNGRRLHIRANTFVLAAGAIENARILLVSGGNPQDAHGNRHGWVGRCFMEHPRDFALTLLPRSPDLFAATRFYDMHRAPDGTFIGGRIALRHPTIRTEQLPNASVTLLPRLKPGSPRAGPAALLLDELRRLGRRRAGEGYGWSAIREPGAVLGSFQLIVNVEQRPHPENRVALGAGRDSLGVPRVELHWRWRDDEQAQLERLRSLIVRELEESRLGQVRLRAGQRPDPNAHHHAGTTRMHADPRSGVVDADGRVHGMDNLYVTGASVFPTAGCANPTLTIVALALRLADHLAPRP
jgi:choline dehydrogenase-like flavoprotein